MDLNFQLTDDQVALLGCLAAIAVSFLLMSLSYHTNPKHRSSQPARDEQPRSQPAVEKRRAA
jgi:hypothetical protein